jgi:hypothetical protein
MAASKVRVNDRRLKKYRAQLDEAMRTKTRVGVLGSEAAESYAGGRTVAYIAAIHELGAGVPVRSWLRGWVNPNEAEIRERLKKALGRCTDGAAPGIEFGKIGAWSEGQIKKRIASGINASPATGVDKQPGKTPLIATGQFRNSITHEVISGRR